MTRAEMTREEAIRTLEFGEWWDFLGDDISDTARAPLFEALETAIAALREREERRWIPVTERLPEPGERVLATDGGFVGELYINSFGQWQRYNVNHHSLLMALDILWWMPLPKPPKGERLWP